MLRVLWRRAAFGAHRGFFRGRRPSDFGAWTFLSAPRGGAPLGRNADLRSAVSQACGLPASRSQKRSGSLSAAGLRRTAGRLEVCDTADRRSALRPRAACGPPIPCKVRRGLRLWDDGSNVPAISVSQCEILGALDKNVRTPKNPRCAPAFEFARRARFFMLRACSSQPTCLI